MSLMGRSVKTDRIKISHTSKGGLKQVYGIRKKGSYLRNRVALRVRTILPPILTYTTLTCILLHMICYACDDSEALMTDERKMTGLIRKASAALNRGLMWVDARMQKKGSRTRPNVFPHVKQTLHEKN